jgi:CheY-like chemotaxis protein
MSGYDVHTADDGTAALNLLGGGGCTPGVILMDAQMPGLSGAPLIGKLRAQSKARVYVISGSNAADEITSAADGFLLKPFPPDALTRMIEEQDGQSEQPGAAGLDPAKAIVNRETLLQLREMMPEAQVRQIFEAIVTDLERRTAALESAIAAADWPEARRLGHSIKGGAAMAGALQVAGIGHLIESGGLEPRPSSSGVNQLDNSSALVQDLRSAARNLQRILDAEFKA